MKTFEEMNSTEKAAFIKSQPKAAKLLRHAYAHCCWGSNADNTDRQPDKADLDAAEILAALTRQHNPGNVRNLRWTTILSV